MELDLLSSLGVSLPTAILAAVGALGIAVLMAVRALRHRSKADDSVRIDLGDER